MPLWLDTGARAVKCVIRQEAYTQTTSYSQKKVVKISMRARHCTTSIPFLGGGKNSSKWPALAGLFFCVRNLTPRAEQFAPPEIVSSKVFDDAYINEVNTSLITSLPTCCPPLCPKYLRRYDEEIWLTERARRPRATLTGSEFIPKLLEISL